MKNWFSIMISKPSDSREVLVYDQEKRRFDICYYSHEDDDVYAHQETLWKNRNNKDVTARFWRDLPFIPGNYTWKLRRKTMENWINAESYIPTYSREVLVYDSDKNRYDICRYDHDTKNNEICEDYINPTVKKWVNRNGENVTAHYWRELPVKPYND